MAFKMKYNSPFKFPFGAFIRLGFTGTKKSILPGSEDPSVEVHKIKSKEKPWTKEEKQKLYEQGLIS